MQWAFWQRALVVTFGLGVGALAGAACDSDSVSPVSGEVTLRADEGVDLLRGTLKKPGNFQNSDLFASGNGSSLKLSSGGDSPTNSRPVNWFETSGGVHDTFGSLAEVPDTLPTDAMDVPLIHAKTGNGFLLQRKDGGYTKGWLKVADDASVTIEFAPVPE